MEAAMPECLRQSPQQCRVIQIDAKVPIEWALPLYGFLMPLIVAITILTNSFIVVVLSHRSLRTPTSFVLGAMAITELLTGLLCLPWLLYYYTFGGYLTDEWQGLPAFWCTLFPYLATSLPSIFHTAAIWLTVYLAVQRYIYICVPKLVQSLCTIRRSKQMIVSICVLSLWVYAPELFASYNQSFRSTNPFTNRTRSMCVMYQTALIQMMGNNLYHMLVFAVHTIIVHTLPCILLVFFTWRLIAAIRKADKKHCNLIGKSNQHHHQQQQRKFTVVTPDEGPGGSARGGSSSNGMTSILAGRSSSSEEADESCGGGSTAVVTTDMPTTNSTTLFTRTSQQQQQQQQRGSLSESKRVQGLRQNTRMLLAVILLFLVTEIPAALIFGMHVGTVALKFTFLQQRHYAIINKLLIVRNVLIVISYPLRFAIYCGMSAQFREVVQQMLAKRKTLFQHFSYGKLRSRGISGEVRRAGSGRKSEGGESSSNSMAHKTSTTLGMLLHTETVVWRNGVGGDAPFGGRRDEMTRLPMEHHSNCGAGGSGGRLSGQTTVLVGNEETDDDERNVEEDEETDELDANTNYDEHL